MKRRTKAQILEDARAADAERTRSFMAGKLTNVPASVIASAAHSSGKRSATLHEMLAAHIAGHSIAVPESLAAEFAEMIAITRADAELTTQINNTAAHNRFNDAIELIDLTPSYIDYDAHIAIYTADSLPTMLAMRDRMASTGVSDSQRVFDVTITDPPYAAETHANARRGGLGTKQLDDSFSAFDRLTMRGAFRSMLALTKRWTVSTIDFRHAAALVDYFDERNRYGRFVRAGVWIKTNSAPQFSGDRPAQGWEQIAILHRQGSMQWNGHGRSSVFTNKVVRGKKHPTQKPLELIEQFVSLFSNPGDLIFDPFVGAGTTLVAAKLLGRAAIGFEISEQYAKLAQSEVEAITL